MAVSPSSSEHSERSSIYWGSEDSDSEPSIAQQYQNPPRPRLSSPRLFQDFFSNTARANARLPPAPRQHNQARLQEFPQAFDNVNRAIQTAHQAFQNSPVVDLTDSPPQQQASPAFAMPPRRMNRDSPSLEYSSSSPPDSSTSRLRHSLDTAASRGVRPSRDESATEERAPKRRRIAHVLDDSNNEEAAGRSGTIQEVEAVDLTEVNTAADLSKALSKQRQDAIQAQMKQKQGSEPVGRTPLSSYKCPICMDTPEDATTTSCGMQSYLRFLNSQLTFLIGHLFCHKCIIDTLRWSEEQRQDEYTHGKAKGTCPVCRKVLARNDKAGSGRTLIPLELKLTKRKKGDVKGKGVAKQGSVTPSKGDRMAKMERESSAGMWEDLTVF